MRNKIKTTMATAICLTTIFFSGCGTTAFGGQKDLRAASASIASTNATITSEENSVQNNKTGKTIYDDIDLSIFDLDRYDNTKYLQYYWDSNITYNESAMIVRNADGTLDPVKLLFNVDKIISVRSADLQTKYVENKDYKIENGILIILEDGDIPILDYNKMYFETNPGKAGSGTTVEGNAR